MGITINTTSGPFVFFAVNCLNLHIKLAYLRPSTIAFMAFKVKRYYKSRITYYNNAVASFNFLELHTQLSGDIHPQPGPDSQLSIPVRITQRSHRQKNSHLSCNHSTSTRIISKTMPTRHSSLMTINTTSSSIRNMENLCLVSRVPYTSKSSTDAHTPNCRNPNNLITIQRLPLKASNARHMSMCLLNARSINNKALFIKDYVVDHQIDILGTTETWTKSDGESNRVVNELSPRDILSAKYREKNDLVVVLACYITQA